MANKKMKRNSSLSLGAIYPDQIAFAMAKFCGHPWKWCTTDRAKASRICMGNMQSRGAFQAAASLSVAVADFHMLIN